MFPSPSWHRATREARQSPCGRWPPPSCREPLRQHSRLSKEGAFKKTTDVGLNLRKNKIGEREPSLMANPSGKSASEMSRDVPARTALPRVRAAGVVLRTCLIASPSLASGTPRFSSRWRSRPAGRCGCASVETIDCVTALRGNSVVVVLKCSHDLGKRVNLEKAGRILESVTTSRTTHKRNASRATRPSRHGG